MCLVQADSEQLACVRQHMRQQEHAHMCLMARHLSSAGQACAQELRLVDAMEQGMGRLLGQLAAVQLLLVCGLGFRV
jgi:hypothetical protein